MIDDDAADFVFFFKGNHKCLDSRLEKSQDLGLTDNDLFDMFGR